MTEDEACPEHPQLITIKTIDPIGLIFNTQPIDSIDTARTSTKAGVTRRRGGTSAAGSSGETGEGGADIMLLQ